ncbi:MAG: 4Fe-4S binding protein [Bacteroidales bacterium]
MQYRESHEIVVLSGKGGTGKTSIAASLAALAKDTAVAADCDVEAANMHLLLKPDIEQTFDFFSGQYAVVREDLCDLCGLCKEKCRFGAISAGKERCHIDPVDCEGCGYCAHICPKSAIEMKPVNSGKVYISHNRLHMPMVHASLQTGRGNSGKLVARVKTEAGALAKTHNKPFIIIDGPPGIGCPAISSLSGAGLVILVAEPAASGIHDLKRLVEVVKKLNHKMACVVNKCDINKEKTAELKSLLHQQNIIHLADLPFDETFTRAIMTGKTMAEIPSPIKRTLIHLWQTIQTNFPEQ